MTFREFLWYTGPIYEGLCLLEADGLIVEVDFGNFIHRPHTKFIDILSSWPNKDAKIAQKQFRSNIANPEKAGLQQFVNWPGIWEVRVGIGFRALAYQKGNQLIWYWIGPREALNNDNLYRAGMKMRATGEPLPPFEPRQRGIPDNPKQRAQQASIPIRQRPIHT